MAKDKISAREIALETIYGVHKGDGYANLLLPNALGKSNLPKRDKAFVTELVYGTLRHEGTLDWIIARYSSRDLGKIPLQALDILRLGCYQIFYTRVAPHAICNESTELAKKLFHKGIASFTNGLLRNIIRKKDNLPWPDYKEDPVSYISLKYSHPKWLVEMWIEDFGLEETKQLCKANNQRPHVSIRANNLKTSRDNLYKNLSNEGIRVDKSKIVPEGIVIAETGEISALPQFKEGLFFVQDESSMTVSHVLNPREGETILDLCAAPGGKATHIAEMMNNKGKIIAVDVHSNRLNLIKDNADRLGVEILETIQDDGTKLKSKITEPIDRILIDAPCSGLGVLARRPDARWRKSLDQIEELSILQSDLLKTAALLVKAGGVIVYSVCTITHQEGIEVIEGFLQSNPEFVLDDAVKYLSKTMQNGEPYKWAQLLPHKHGTDGLFIARMVRNK